MPHIPADKIAAVTRGLREAFGVTECDEIRELPGGPAWNPVFRIVVRGSAYLLRINLRAGDLARHYTCMRAAAEAGLAPRVWYTSVEDRISITGFVEAVPFPRSEAMVRMPAVLRALHSLPPFPEIPAAINTSCTFLLNKGPAVDAFTQRFQAANIFSRSETEESLSRFRQVAAVYPKHEADRVSSHNDLFKPDNILFDGQRVWLIDWEAAFLNDRYADLAVVANLLVTDETEERAFLDRYFEKPPSEYQYARFFLMRQLTHMFYAVAFLLIGSSAGMSSDSAENVPEFREFNQRMWVGDVSLADNRTKVLYGRVHWQQLLHNIRHARFDEALGIVADRHSIPEGARN